MLAVLTAIFGVAGALLGTAKSAKVSAAVVTAMRTNGVPSPKGPGLVFHEPMSSSQLDSAGQAFNAPRARAVVS